MQKPRCLFVVKKIAAALMGALAGAINMLFGGGGGILAVPALQKTLDVEEKQAHASAVAVMLPLSLLSLVLISLRSVPEFKIALPVGLGALLGGGIGGMVLSKLPKTLLSFLFYGVMIYVGIRYIM